MKQFFTFLFLGITLLAQAKIPDFPEEGRVDAVQFVIDNTVYVGLGKNSRQTEITFWKYKHGDANWSKIADFPGKGRVNAIAFTLNGKGYVGLGQEDYGRTKLKDFYCYNAVSNTWTKCSNDFGGTARSSAVSFVIGNKAYVGTGRDASGSCSDFWCFDGNTWTSVNAKFSGDKRQDATSFVINGKAYVSGGADYDNGTFVLSDVQEFDPATNKWTEKIFADGINLSFQGATSFSYKGKGYICYGNKDGVVTYDPTTNKVENIGDKFELGANVSESGSTRSSLISFIINNVPYVGLGSSGLLTTTYHKEFKPLFTTCIIRFDGNGHSGGSVPKLMVVERNEFAKLPGQGNMRKDGFKFLGWGYKPDGSWGFYLADKETQFYNATMNLYAVWLEDKHYVLGEKDIIVTDNAIMYDSGGPYGDLKMNKNEVTTTFLPFTKENKMMLILEKIDLRINTRLYIYDGEDENSPLLAKYEYRGSFTDNKVIATNAKGALTVRLSGHMFAYNGKGWESKLKSVPISTQEIKFHGNGNDGGTPPATFRHQTSSSFKMPGGGSLTKQGYQFVRWNTKPDGTGIAYAEGDDFVMKDQSIVFYAEWCDLNSMNVCQMKNGLILTDSCMVNIRTIGSQEQSEDKSYRMTFLPKTKGKRLMFWTDKGSGTSLGRVVDVYDGLTTDPSTQIASIWDSKNLYSSNQLGALTVVFREFWSFNPDCNVYIKCIPEQTVSFDLNGGIGAVQNMKSIATDSIILPDHFNLSNGDKVFTGWNTKVDGTGTRYMSKEKFKVPMRNIKLYAQWQSVTNENDILINKHRTIIVDSCYFYDPGGKYVKSVNSGTYSGTHRDTITFIPAKKGYKLKFMVKSIHVGDYDYFYVDDGLSVTEHSQLLSYNRYVGHKSYKDTIWALNHMGALTFRFQSYGSSASYDGWRIKVVSYKPVKHAIIFDGNGNTVGDKSSTIKAFTAKTISLPDGKSISKLNHVFVGWNSKQDGSGIWYKPSQKVQVTTDMKFFAIWGNLISEEGGVKADSGFIFDSGSLAYGYKKNENYIRTIYPDRKKHKLEFKLLELKEYCSFDTGDTLFVYDGSSVNSPLLTKFYSGKSNRNKKFVATNTQGAITMRFKSDEANEANGWIIKYWIKTESKVVFSKNGYLSAGQMPDTIIGKPDSVFSIPSAQGLYKEGYKFKCWNTRPDGTGEVFEPEQTMAIPYNDLILYAIWEMSKDEDFIIKSYSETCPYLNNGSIEIISGNYSGEIQFNNQDYYQLSKNSKVVIRDLYPKKYDLIIEGEGFYKEYIVTVKAAEELKTKYTVNANSISFEFEGGMAPYFVELGDEEFSSETNKLTIENLKGGHYQAKIRDNSNCSKNLEAFFDIERFYVHPNPVTGSYINAVIPSDLEQNRCVISILSVDGREVKSKVVNNEKNVKINIADCQPGLYIMQLKGESYQSVVKVIIRK